MAGTRQLIRIVPTALLIAALSWCTLPGWISAADPPSACAPLVMANATDADGLIPIQSLAEGNVFDHGPPESLLIVTGRPDPIVAVIDPAAWPAVEGVELDANVLVSLFIGRWPQIGHRVSIETVRSLDSGVCITARVTGPGPDQDASDAEIYPYHVISVPRAALPEAPRTTWTVVSPDGTPIATTRFP